ncbi:MAG: ATP-binding protein [Acidimicrobiales bacterium]
MERSSREFVELIIPARPEYLALVPMGVAVMADQVDGIDEVRTEDLRLAVSEAVTNAMDAYAELGQADGRIIVRYRVADDGVEVEVFDRAGGFDLVTLPRHPPDDLPSNPGHERGLGIPLIRALTDEVDFNRSDGGTAVRMVVRPVRR